MSEGKGAGVGGEDQGKPGESKNGFEVRLPQPREVVPLQWFETPMYIDEVRTVSDQGSLEPFQLETPGGKGVGISPLLV